MNHDQLLARRRRWYRKNRIRLAKQLRQWRNRNRAHFQAQQRGYSRRNYKNWKPYPKHKKAAIMKRWRAKNRLKIQDYYRRRYRTNVGMMLRTRLSSRVSKVLLRRRVHKNNSTVTLLGCSLDQFKAHLEKLFKDGMGWHNRSLWHIDHIRPCKAFDLRDPAQQAECFNYRNLQPLWSFENLAKAASL